MGVRGAGGNSDGLGANAHVGWVIDLYVCQVEPCHGPVTILGLNSNGADREVGCSTGKEAAMISKGISVIGWLQMIHTSYHQLPCS